MLRNRDKIEKLKKGDFIELLAYQKPNDTIMYSIQLLVLPLSGKLLKYNSAKAKLQRYVEDFDDLK